MNKPKSPTKGPAALATPLAGLQRPVKWNWGFLGGSADKEPTCQCRRFKRHGFNPWVRKILLPWRRKCQPLQCSCLENSTSLVGYIPQGHKASDMTERTGMHAKWN